MHILKFHFLSATLLLALTLGDPIQAQPEDPALLNAGISGLALEDEIRDLKLLSAEGPQTIHLYANARSRTIQYSGPDTLVFFREKEAPAGEEGPLRIPVGRVTLDGQHARYLLFFTKKTSSEESYSIFAIPDTTDGFKAGTYRFLNLAPYDVAVKIGESRHVLKERNITDVAGDFEHGNYYQTILLSLPDKAKDPVPAYSGRVYFNKHIRMLYIIRPRAGGSPGKIQFTGIPERVATGEQP